MEERTIAVQMIDADEKAKIGAFVAGVVAGIALIEFLAEGGAPHVFGIFLYVILAWALAAKRSRTAAILLAVLYPFVVWNVAGPVVTGSVGRWAAHYGIGGLAVLLSLQGLRGVFKGLGGTFDYHRLQKAARNI